MRFRYRLAAVDEAEEAANWLEDQQAGLGNRFLDVLRNTLDDIRDQPDRYPKLETVETARDVRRVILSPFQYFIAFEIQASCLLILTVSHVRQEPGHWLDRLE